MKKYLLGCWLVVSCLLKESIFAQAPAKITAAEYFIDIDPGTGNASSIAIATTDSALLALNVATNIKSSILLSQAWQQANNSWK